MSLSVVNRGALGVRHLGGRGRIQYGRAAMRLRRRGQATTGLVALIVLLGSLWAGVLGVSGPRDPADQLITSHAPLGVGAAVLPEPPPVLGTSAERPDPGGRLLPLLLGLLAASLVVAGGRPATRGGPGRAPARPPVLAAPRGPRAPPRLQPA
jgi:hypothetical protein